MSSTPLYKAAPPLLHGECKEAYTVTLAEWEEVIRDTYLRNREEELLPSLQ